MPKFKPFRQNFRNITGYLGWVTQVNCNIQVRDWIIGREFIAERKLLYWLCHFYKMATNFNELLKTIALLT